MKQTYKDCSSKKLTRDFLFSLFAEKQLHKIIGLGGPDINDYIKFCKNNGYKEFVIFENHFSTLVEQVKYIRTRNKVELRYSDILGADDSRTDVLFDLDFCASVLSLKEHIKKFKHNFIITFSRRPIGDEKTLKLFFRAQREKIAFQETFLSPIEHTIFKTTNGSEYVRVNYFDTTPMCCFAKIK